LHLKRRAEGARAAAAFPVSRQLPLRREEDVQGMVERTAQLEAVVQRCVYASDYAAAERAEKQLQQLKAAHDHHTLEVCAHVGRGRQPVGHGVSTSCTCTAIELSPCAPSQPQVLAEQHAQQCAAQDARFNAAGQELAAAWERSHAELHLRLQAAHRRMLGRQKRDTEALLVSKCCVCAAV
jgi:hypothetical protein